VSKLTPLTDELHEYLCRHRSSDDQILEDLRVETVSRFGEASRMQTAPEQGTLLRLLTSILDAQLAVEIGVFTGHSSVQIARGLAPGGKLLCFDISEEYTQVARRYWERAGLRERIQLTLGSALDSLAALPSDASIDFAFIDADKGNYIAYYETIVARLRPNGLLAVDNVLWSGRVIDPADQSPDTVAIRACNEHILQDRRVESVMVHVADGLTLVRKLP
jgi:predicted O-methyltransferase YrrM